MAEHGENENLTWEDEEKDGICEPGGEGVDELPSLVARKVLSASRRDDSQRNALFWTRCTISNQIFELNIDTGSCEKIISRNLVEKLGLSVEKHPETYSIVWITSGAGIKVNERCNFIEMNFYVML